MTSHYGSRSLVGLCLLTFVLGSLAGCELEGVTPDGPGLITFKGREELEVGVDGVQIVDSTVTVGVFVADGEGNNRGVPVPDVDVTWTVSHGSVAPEVSVTNGDGVAKMEWTLGHETEVNQVVTAEVAGTDIRTTLDVNVAAGPPVNITLDPTQLELKAGQIDTLQITELSTVNGERVDPSDFDLHVKSSDTTVARYIGQYDSGPTTADLSFQGVAGGSAEITIDVTGTPAVAHVTADVESFAGFFARFQGIAAGDKFACGIAAEGMEATAGSVYCWGQTTSGRLGNAAAPATPVLAPRPSLPVEGLPTGVEASDLATGGAHGCAVVGSSDNNVYCWGANGSQQRATQTTTAEANQIETSTGGRFPSTSPADGESFFTDVAAGANHTCILGESGAVYCFGSNEEGQLGDPAAGSGDYFLPRAVQGLSGVTVAKLAETGPAASTSCAITAGGALYCWGRNYGETASEVATGIQWASTSVTDVGSYQGSRLCVVEQSGSIRCWEGGDATSATRYDERTYALVSAAPEHTCALTESGDAYCFGSAEDGRLGNGVDGSGLPVETPVSVQGIETDLTSLTLGPRFSLSIRAGGQAYSWGSNEDFNELTGQLGIGTQEDLKTTATRIRFFTGTN